MGSWTIYYKSLASIEISSFFFEQCSRGRRVTGWISRTGTGIPAPDRNDAEKKSFRGMEKAVCADRLVKIRMNLWIG